MMQLTNVLVICAGNICRSPLAAALLARDLPGVTVSSVSNVKLVRHLAQYRCDLASLA